MRLRLRLLLLGRGRHGGTEMLRLQGRRRAGLREGMRSAKTQCAHIEAAPAEGKQQKRGACASGRSGRAGAKRSARRARSPAAPQPSERNYVWYWLSYDAGVTGAGPRMAFRQGSCAPQGGSGSDTVSRPMRRDPGRL
jgi:hypothetical protein